jgi:hypothetical protein
MAKTEQHIRLRDTKPYFLPDSLSQLSGPYDGKITLRHSVFWAPGSGSIDIGPDSEARVAYQALITEGKAEDQIKEINRSRLLSLWPSLHLDRRVRSTWEAKFPELKRP